MKKLLAILVFVSGLMVDGWAGGTFTISDASIKRIPRYVTPKKAPYGCKLVELRMDFGTTDFSEPKKLEKLKDAQILKVQLVYTNYRHSREFDQSLLNEDRLEALQEALPDELSNPMIHLELVEQVACSNERLAKIFFHGFVITVVKPPSKEMMAKESDFLVDAVKYEITDDAYTDLKKDSTVWNVFERNDHWDDMLIVTDVTGSMSPYNAQLLLWFKLNFEKRKVKQYVFFNDGDLTPDYLKEVGKVGGIYQSDASDLDTVLNTAQTAMRNGFGGDAPENNIEAIIKGMEDCEDCGDIIMIADNWATPRDLKLAKEIGRPIHIVLCGTDMGWGYSGLNVEYLNLVRETGGSVHTMEEDLEDLMELNEGETIEFGGKTYEVRDGKFVELKTV